MTMYFVQTPTTNHILKACYSLAILTVFVVVSCCCQTTTTTTATTSDHHNHHHHNHHHLHHHHYQQHDTHTTDKIPPADTQLPQLQQQVARDGGQAADGQAAVGVTDEPPPRPATNPDPNDYNINIDTNNKLIINPNAGAKSLEGVRQGEEADSVARVELDRTSRESQQTVGDGGHRETAATATSTLHKLMSEIDLRRTFQVETHDQVPEYQVLKLTVSHDGSHLISPISDLGELLITSTSSNQPGHHHTTSSKSDVSNDGAGFRSSGRPQQEAAATEASEQRHNTRTSDGESGVGGHERSGRVKRSAGKQRTGGDQQQQQQQHDERLIVMNLSTFGQDFSLRLKRNADFQQRIKDMKMFLAESTGDGSLRYTEIENPSSNQRHHHKQEPHKRAASSDAVEPLDEPAQRQQQLHAAAKSDVATTTATAANATSKTQNSSQPQHGATSADKRQQQHQDWNIGSTYHDEENLAALLIERDRLTGQIKVDGTIGNDFVIKPMPRATIEALAARQRLATDANQATDLKRAEANTSESSAAIGGGGGASKSQTETVESSAANELRQAANHMHDDDPHDDDEMFLDEDEALELANLNATSVAAMRTGTNSTGNTPAASLSQPQLQTARTLSKAAAERKWRKYRKLMAQTRVPKPAEQRARRHSAGPVNKPREETVAGGGSSSSSSSSVAPTKPQPLHMSHHIVYRQRPSSEASSSEHRHSFMMAPGQQTMEAMARRFPGPRSSAEGAGSRLALDEADYAHDPLGGQFYLEPGSITGFERAGHADWSLVYPTSTRRHSLGALPPYALNNTTANYNATTPASSGNSTTPPQPQPPPPPPSSSSSPLPPATTTEQHARFKRHAPRQHAPRLSSHAHRGAAAASNRRHKRQAPDVVWPEVLLVVDYDSFLLHGGDSREVKRYFVSFWNGVDLRYKLLVNPHIRISLAGMIVAKDRDATPYLERNRLRAPNADAVDAAGALTDMGKYLYREDRLPTYDLAVVITKLDMCRRRYEGGRCNRGTAGFAYVGGACVVNKRLEKVNSVAIIEDSGGFSGIIVAAHEVGHLLGCVHDGSPPPSYLGGPGATHCPWEDGFIMSDLRHTERGFRWSQCSVEQFKHFLNGETATCLYNYPHESQMLHRLLPGSMLSLDDQCKRDRGTNACFKDARVCAQLFCFDSASGYCVSYRPAAEGSPCGDGHVCRNGKCVGEIENIIPDYTHQSQTVVAAGGRQRSLAAAGSSPSVSAAALVAVAPARLADNGLSASSTSTATSSPDGSGGDSSGISGTSAKLIADGGGGISVAPASVGQVSSRRMDTVQVDTPLSLARTGHLYQPVAPSLGGQPDDGSSGSEIPTNNYRYNQQRRQAPSSATTTTTSTTTAMHQNHQPKMQAHQNYHQNHQHQPQPQQRHYSSTPSIATGTYKQAGQYSTAPAVDANAMRLHAKLTHNSNNNNNNHHHHHLQEQQAAARLRQLQAASSSYAAEPFTFSSQRERDLVTLLPLNRSNKQPQNELYALSSSVMSATSSLSSLPSKVRQSPRVASSTDRSSMRSRAAAYGLAPPDSSSNFATGVAY